MSFNRIKQNKSIFKSFISWYSVKLNTHPFSTKAITSGLIAGAGDLTCQYIVQRQTFQEHELVYKQQQQQHTQEEDNDIYNEKFRFEPDLIRTSRFTILGFALIAPVVHVSLLCYLLFSFISTWIYPD